MNLQRIVKALPQARGEGQRPAEIQDIPLDRAALRKPGNRLVGDGLVDRGGDIARPRALIDQRLHIALGKDAAARCDGIGPARLHCRSIHLIRPHLQKRGHLIDEGPGAAGAGAVHGIGRELLAVLEDHLEELQQVLAEIADALKVLDHLKIQAQILGVLL